jgi:hypothetical protein
VHCRVQKTPSLDPILIEVNPVHTFPSSIPIIIIILVVVVVVMQGIGNSRPVPVQNCNFGTYESIWTRSETHTSQKNADTHPYPQAGFEPVIPVFERSKTVHSLDRAAIGLNICSNIIFPTTSRPSEWSHSFRFSNQNIICISLLFHEFYMPHRSHPWSP